MTKLLLTGLVVLALCLTSTYTQAVQCPSWASSYSDGCNNCGCPPSGGQGSGYCTRMYCGWIHDQNPRKPICTPNMPVHSRSSRTRVCDETGLYRFCAGTLGGWRARDVMTIL